MVKLCINRDNPLVPLLSATWITVYQMRKCLELSILVQFMSARVLASKRFFLFTPVMLSSIFFNSGEGSQKGKKSWHLVCKNSYVTGFLKICPSENGKNEEEFVKMSFSAFCNTVSQHLLQNRRSTLWCYTDRLTSPQSSTMWQGSAIVYRNHILELCNWNYRRKNEIKRQRNHIRIGKVVFHATLSSVNAKLLQVWRVSSGMVRPTTTSSSSSLTASSATWKRPRWGDRILSARSPPSWLTTLRVPWSPHRASQCRSSSSALVTKTSRWILPMLLVVWFGLVDDKILPMLLVVWFGWW